MWRGDKDLKDEKKGGAHIELIFQQGLEEATCIGKGPYNFHSHVEFLLRHFVFNFLRLDGRLVMGGKKGASNKQERRWSPSVIR